jgi:hypothetical protein
MVRTLSLLGKEILLPACTTDTIGKNLRPRCSISAELATFGTVPDSTSTNTTVSASGLPAASLTWTAIPVAQASAGNREQQARTKVSARM